MTIKNIKNFRKINIGLINSTLFAFISAAEIRAQARTVPPAPPVQSGDSTLLYISLLVVAVALTGVFLWWRNSKKTGDAASSATKPSASSENEADMDSVDGDKELEWLRKNRKIINRNSKEGGTPQTRTVKTPPAPLSEEAQNYFRINLVKEPEDNSLPLPIFSIKRRELAGTFDALPISNDEDLMSAVEQSYDEFEEDEEVRELAVRILAAFKKRNSVEALSQIALYDLSANLRSKAVTILSEFDHESVFETILLANADPTREVRAAAARGLTKLTFNRADAWTRIAETREDGRIRQSARAAMESGFVDMSFDRLISRDSKQAYEAFTLMTLLIEAGEIEKMMDTLENHREMNVRRAILHTVKVSKNQKGIDRLELLLKKNTQPIGFQEEIDKAIEEVGYVTV